MKDMSPARQQPGRSVRTVRAGIARCASAALLVLAFMGATPPANDDRHPEINATVSPAKATVGDFLEYRVLVRGRDLGRIEIVPPEKRELYPEKETGPKKPAPDASADGDPDPGRHVPIYVIHSMKKNDRSSGAITDIAVNIRISYYHPGRYELPIVEIRGADGIPIAYKLPVAEITETNQKGELQPPEPPLELSGNYWRLVFVGLGLLAAAVAGYFTWRYLVPLVKRLRAAPPVPPLEAFMKDIEAFAGHELIAAGRIEEYVFGISMIFRRFLSRGYGLDAEEMTSNEAEAALRRAAPESYRAHQEAISRCFMLWDISKFAEFTPDEASLRENLEQTIRLAHDLAPEDRNDDGQT